ncbi:MAG: 50S ribosomal protein L9 [Bacilli bacterium]|jgi:large subunit ribosomal protein L9|nr:50S ribosomal protein L9 [Bacilli bacterium]
MKVLMKKDLRKVGKRGEVIDVSDGYGANYLIPNGFAVLYTADAQKQFAIEKEQERQEIARKTEEAKALAEQLKTITLEFSASAGRNGDMIGTVSFKKVLEALKKDYDIKLDKGQIVEKDVIINGFGLTTLKVNIFNGVIGEIRIHVSLKEKK